MPLSMSPQSFKVILATCQLVRSGTLHQKINDASVLTETAMQYTQKLECWLRTCLPLSHLPETSCSISLSALVFHTLVMHEWPRDSGRLGRRARSTTANVRLGGARVGRPPPSMPTFVDPTLRTESIVTGSALWNYRACQQAGCHDDDAVLNLSLHQAVQLIYEVTTYLRAAPNLQETYGPCMSCTSPREGFYPPHALLCWWTKKVHQLKRYVAYITVASVPVEYLQNPLERLDKKLKARSARRAQRIKARMNKLAASATDKLASILQQECSTDPRVVSKAQTRLSQPSIKDLFSQQLKRRRSYESLDADPAARRCSGSSSYTPQAAMSTGSYLASSSSSTGGLFEDNARARPSAFVLTGNEKQKEHERVAQRIIELRPTEGAAAAEVSSDSDTSQGEEDGSAVGEQLHAPQQGSHSVSLTSGTSTKPRKLQQKGLRFWMEQAKLHQVAAVVPSSGRHMGGADNRGSTYHASRSGDFHAGGAAEARPRW